MREANAVFADALGALKQSRAARRAVSTPCSPSIREIRPHFEARAELELRTGNAPAAVVDAQKLVTVLPTSTDARLLLARCYSAAGDKAWVESYLWTAFAGIPADENIYAALGGNEKGDSGRNARLQEEFERQR